MEQKLFCGTKDLQANKKCAKEHEAYKGTKDKTRQSFCKDKLIYQILFPNFVKNELIFGMIYFGTGRNKLILFIF